MKKTPVPLWSNAWVISGVVVAAFLCLIPVFSPKPLDEFDLLEETQRVSHRKATAKPRIESKSDVAANSIGSDLDYSPRFVVDSSGYQWVLKVVEPWPKDSSLSFIAERFKGALRRTIDQLGQDSERSGATDEEISMAKYARASFLNFDGNPNQAYADLSDSRKIIEKYPEAASKYLYTMIYFQGISSLRRGENENCIDCRGESSCIIPIDRKAVHKIETGSRQAIKHFTEYLDKFPDDDEVKWLLNVAYMTLGEHPHAVPKNFLIDLTRYYENEFDIGVFKDIGDAVGLNRLNQAGGAIMEDFDNDNLLDVVVSSFDPTQVMGVYVNDGNGKFTNVTKQAGLNDQLGGLNCMQTDYNNDGYKDVLIVRGAWLTGAMAMRPTLLKNNGDKTFTDVTIEAGLGEPVNSITAAWSDYDNDGWLDVLVCCEQQLNRLYHNKKDGTFEEVASQAGLQGREPYLCKGIAWTDFDNDGYSDVFLTHLSSDTGHLFRNNRDGTFTDVNIEMKVRGPVYGFACWSWDYDNDGFEDIFATSYDRSVGGVVAGMTGRPHKHQKNVLYRNVEGKHYVDVTAASGLDSVFATMGCNFGDLDNDGLLDMYLGTGDPNLGTLVPNRMFKNVEGKRFAEITTSSHTGNLQKGHGVSIGDWDSDGNVDLFVEMGGAVNGDKYHNILLQNPGNENNWINLKLEGVQSNRAAIGARIRVFTNDPDVGSVYRTVRSGSSFGANPLEQHIGIGKASKIERIEVDWPTSQSRQVFEDVEPNQYLRIREFESKPEKIERSPIAHKSASPRNVLTSSRETSAPVE